MGRTVSPSLIRVTVRNLQPRHLAQCEEGKVSMSNHVEITVGDIADVLEHTLFSLKHPRGHELKPAERHVPFILGQFGIGKTAIPRQFCKKITESRPNGIYYHPVLLGQYDTVDLKGFPGMQNIGTKDEPYNSTVWSPASTLPFKKNPLFPTDRPILLHLDELTSAAIPIMGICYQLIQEKRIGEHELMDNVYILASGNRDVDHGIVNRMPKPLDNRLDFYLCRADLDAVCLHMEETYGMDATKVHIAFWNFRKNLLVNYDPKNASERVVATPRSWERHIHIYNADMPSHIKAAACSGCVGAGVHLEFEGFEKIWQHIRGMMKDIQANPTKVKVPEHEKDAESMRYALAVCIAGEVNKKNLPAFDKYMLRMPQEYQVLMWKLACKRDTELADTPEFLAHSIAMRKVFTT
jgi:hypothetical protein